MGAFWEPFSSKFSSFYKNGETTNDFEKIRKIDDVVIFGHWASIDGVTDSPNVIGLDTGCVWGNKMTLMALESRTFYRCNC